MDTGAPTAPCIPRSGVSLPIVAHEDVPSRFLSSQGLYAVIMDIIEALIWIIHAGLERALTKITHNGSTQHVMTLKAGVWTVW